MGAYEFPIPVAVNADYTNVVTNFLVHLSGQVVAGNVSVILLDFGDGTILTNQLSAAHSWAAPGDYAVTLTVFSDLYPGGISALVTVHVAEGNYLPIPSHPTHHGIRRRRTFRTRWMWRPSAEQFW
jgi:hypothetical protein